jgi:hypothetical protein
VGVADIEDALRRGSQREEEPGSSRVRSESYKGAALWRATILLEGDDVSLLNVAEDAKTRLRIL